MIEKMRKNSENPRNLRAIIALALVALIISACGNKVKRDDDSHKEYSIFNENLIAANKYLVKEDAERIQSYIKRRNWQMQDGEGGLKYLIFDHGSGDSISISPKVSMDYRLELLDGTVCYTSAEEGEKELVVGSSEMEPGLARAFKKFRHGDSAVMILPPHYAKGLIGDMNQIPPHSVIVYYTRMK